MDTDEIFGALIPDKIRPDVTMFTHPDNPLSPTMHRFYSTLFIDLLLLAYEPLLEVAHYDPYNEYTSNLSHEDKPSYEVTIVFMSGYYSIVVFLDDGLVINYMVTEHYNRPVINPVP